MVMHGYALIYTYVLQHMDTYMDIHGYTRTSLYMGIRTWMDIHVYPRMYVDVHGITWTHTDYIDIHR